MKRKSKGIGALPVDLKVRNRMLILNAIKDGNLYSAADIAKETGISRPTVVKSIQYFIDRNLIVSQGKGESTEIGGKKPELYGFIYKKLLLTITMWPDFLALNLCTMNLKKIASVKIEAPIKNNPQEAFDLIREKSLSLITQQGYQLSDLYGVSLSTAGTIDYETGNLKYSSRTPLWGTNVPIKKHMREIFGEKVEILIENAGKMTGRYELVRSEEEQNRILVLFSTWGLSACLIERGHVLSGDDSLIGEVGHMVIDPHDEVLCGCGSYGCAERMLSIEKVKRLSKNEDITFEELFIASQKGEEWAREIVKYLANTFAYLVRNISLVFNPNVVVFQGDYSHADDYFKNTLKNRLSEFKYYPKGGAFEIEYNEMSLEELDLSGALNFLQRKFFQDEALYQ
ncbi:N-acetylglucosamine repressor [Aequitasia blattaphilus]|uniref:ROK family protein n=1 Tax=Aequitasia blattaphilus TaxID=2949332 RepID=A0ABT1E8U5_9FIRM|nr:ROK family transcriptional regulator [Aequitasia blattaphilus]MCP1102131.1 ROK family protein [Aequitasia blattaphilus]MCR8614771.1 ROK family protein [Aequitasia blattaphilus]